MPLEADLTEDTKAGSWTFDADVAGAFDDMLERSIPMYATMRSVCFEVGSSFVQPKTWVVDLGCSRGEALAPFVDRFGAHNRYLGVEVSDPMIEAARERFSLWSSVVDIKKVDLRSDYPPVSASVALAVLTLQFVPIEHRGNLVARMHEALLPGGAAIVVEKVLGGSPMVDRLLVDRYRAMKRSNGYTEDEIMRKALALEGILVPVTARWNEELLRAVGFREVECIWRWMNFAAWVAVK